MSTEPKLMERMAYALFCFIGLIVLAWVFNAWVVLPIVGLIVVPTVLFAKA